MELSVISYNSISYLKNRMGEKRLQQFQLEGTFNDLIVAQLQVVVGR